MLVQIQLKPNLHINKVGATKRGYGWGPASVKNPNIVYIKFGRAAVVKWSEMNSQLYLMQNKQANNTHC